MEPISESVSQKFESAEEGSIMSDVAAIKELCDESAEHTPSVEDKLVAAVTIARTEYAKYDRLYQEVAKPILDARREALKDIAELTFAGYAFQDADGIVYQLDRCEGRFVYFEPFEIKRTRRDCEAKGSLSMKAARELGFEPYEPKKAEAA